PCEGHGLVRIAGYANAHELRPLAEDREVPARVDRAVRCAAFLQSSDGDIDRESFRNAAEVEPSPPGEANLAPGQELNVFPGCAAAEGGIEGPVACAAYCTRRAQHPVRPGMHANGAAMAEAVDPREVAFIGMSAHEPMRLRHECERMVHGLLVAIGADRHECAEKRAGAGNHLAWAVRAYASSSRRTPSVICRHESVAPLMFWMSSSKVSLAPFRLPTNCERQ